MTGLQTSTADGAGRAGRRELQLERSGWQRKARTGSGQARVCCPEDKSCSWVALPGCGAKEQPVALKN